VRSPGRSSSAIAVSSRPPEQAGQAGAGAAAAGRRADWPIESEDYPASGSFICRKPLGAEERGRERESLLHATERKLFEIERRVEHGTLQGEGGDRPHRRRGLEPLIGPGAL
jgi:hypothetical protein